MSPQELRQALLPGRFSDYVDETAAESSGLRNLLGLTGPDPRMRDTEILSRFLAFRFYAENYPGRMTPFLDDTFEQFNSKWNYFKPRVEAAVADFERGTDALVRVFGQSVARKPESRQFNRAIFDALIYFHSQRKVRQVLRAKRARIREAYQGLFESSSGFLKAVESDTAGAPNTAARLRVWAKALSRIAGEQIRTPKIPTSSRTQGSDGGSSGPKKRKN